MSGWSKHTAGGVEYYERPGDGPVVVLLHGIGSQATSFTPLLSHLAEGSRIIAWNAPGYGKSAPLDEPWPSARDYAAKLKGLFEARDIDGVTLVGHSLGALIATAFTAHNRDLVARLVIASPALGHGVPRGGGLSSAAQARIDDLERMGPEAFAAARAARLVYAPDKNPGIVAKVRDGMSKVTMPGYGQAARMLASGRLLDDAECLAVPTDVVVGAQDVVTPPDGARLAHRAIPTAVRGTLTLIPDTGHALYQQTPAAFAATLETQPETAG